MYRYDTRVPIYVLDGLGLTELNDFDRLLTEEKATTEKVNFMFALIFSMRTAFYEYAKRQAEKNSTDFDLDEPVYEDVISMNNTELGEEYKKCADIIIKELTPIPKVKEEKKKKQPSSPSTSKTDAKG